MHISDLIVSLILLGLSLPILFSLIMLVIRPFKSSFKINRGSLRLKRARARMNSADAMLEQKSTKAAISELRKALLLHYLPEIEIVKGLKDHYQNILSRLLIIAEHQNTRIENIADIELLFIKQSELQLELLSNKANFSKFQKRRKNDGKDIPQWKLDDFSNKQKELKQSLATNTKELELELDKLFKMLRNPNTQPIVYH